MTSETPIEQASEGAVKGLLDWSTEKIENFYVKFINKELWALEDISIVKLIKEQKTTPAWEFYNKYIQNPQLKYYAQLGLALRNLESDQDKLQNLRSKIGKTYGSKELHQAEFVQSKILSKYIATEIDTAKSNQDLTKKVEGIMDNIDKDYRFIRSSDKIDKKAIDVVAYIKGSLPDVFVLASKLSAIEKCKSIIDNIRPQIEDDYRLETINEQDEYVVFIKRKINTEIL